MSIFENVRYCVALRAKPGEYLALGMLREDVAERLLPRLIFAPPKRDDPNQTSFLDGEFVFDLGRLMGSTWLFRPFLADVTHLFGVYGSNLERWLMPALRQASFDGLLPIPCLALRDIDGENLGSLVACLNVVGGHAAIVVSLEEAFEQASLQTMASRLTAAGVDLSKCAILANLSDADFSIPELAAPIMEGVAESIAETGRWGRVVLQGSNYPEGAIPADPSSSKIIHRGEWMSFSACEFKSDRLRQIVLFGDFGADHGAIDFSGGGRARPYLRYAIDDGWMIVRGANDRRWEGEMRTVAKSIVGHPSFGGRQSSAADATIYRMATGAVSKSKPYEWRAINMCRHVSKVMEDIGFREGFELTKVEVVAVAEQESLL